MYLFHVGVAMVARSVTHELLAMLHVRAFASPCSYERLYSDNGDGENHRRHREYHGAHDIGVFVCGCVNLRRCVFLRTRVFGCAFA